MTTIKWSAQLLKALLITAVLNSTAALAVGFGEITLKSALNEPLVAEIALTNTGSVEEGMLLAQLASPAAFTQAGVNRGAYLTQLNFVVTRNAAGERVIQVSGSEPLTEPYMDFLVELEWPSGRMMREYTLLLDLPDYSGTAVPAAVQSTAQAATASPSGQFAGPEHRVVVGDTLWNVAKRLRPQGMTILQTMDALYSQNPKAFVNGNANNMKKGAVLRLPTKTDIGQDQGYVVANQIGINGPDQIADKTPAVEQPLAVKEPSAVVEPSALKEPLAEQELLPEQAPPAIVDALATTELPAEEQLFPEEGLFPEGDELETIAGIAADSEEPLGQDLEAGNTLAQNLPGTELQADVAPVAEPQQAETAAPLSAKVTAKPAAKPAAELTAMERVKKIANGLVLLVDKKPPYAWSGLAGLGLLLILLILWLTRKRTISVDECPIRPIPEPTPEIIVDTGADQLIDDPDAKHLDPEQELFDETDTEIFAETDASVNKEIFGAMVDAMEEAEVFLSLGDTDGAINVLERARRVSDQDTACRLKLMELLFKDGSTDKLKLIAEEINKTGDEEAIAMASVILGDKQEMTLNPASLALNEKPDLEVPSPFQEPTAGDSIFAEGEPSVAKWEEPSANKEPSANQEPSAEQEPSANKEPSAELEPSANEEPSADKEPSAEQVPSAELEPSANQEPSANKEPSAEETPVAKAPEPEPTTPEPDSLEELESAGDKAIDELAESVLDEDFLDDSFMDGGIFADVGEVKKPKENTQPEDLGLEVNIEELPGAADLENSMGDEVIAEFMASLDDFEGVDDVEELNSVDVKMDMANTFIEMGDTEGAREILNEIIGEADQEGQAKAKALLDGIDD
jgi:pilus assembly protein FimV